MNFSSYIYIYIYGWRSSCDDISDADDAFDQWNPNTATAMEDVNRGKGHC